MKNTALRVVRAFRTRWRRLLPLAVMGLSILGSGALALAQRDIWGGLVATVGTVAMLTWLIPKIFRRTLNYRVVRYLRLGEPLKAARLVSPRASHFDISLLSRISAETRSQGYLSVGRDLLARVVRRGQDPRDIRALDQLNGTIALLRGENLPTLPALDIAEPTKGRVLHVVKRSLADAQAGYTVRTHHTAVAQAARGLDVHVVSQLGIHDAAATDRDWALDGVTYHRLNGPSQREMRHDEWFRAHTEALARLVQELRPEVLHAASDFINARAARLVGTSMGIPVIYEVRGFWEETLISSLARRHNWGSSSRRSKTFGLPDIYRWRQENEQIERMKADAIVTLAPVMADKVVTEGVPRERVTIVPNAIDPDDFTPIQRDRDLLRELGFRDDTTVIGYVSSLSEYEGVDVLIKAFARLRKRARPGGLGLLIVGSGADLPRLQAIADEVGTEGIVFTGRVPHVDVHRYYSVIDVFVVPRLPVTVCHLVTPLKPYEAFALERAVVLSDVTALAGIAAESGSAMLAKAGSARSLARTIGRALDNDEMRLAMARRARQWVIENRTWEGNARLYEDLYGALSKSRHAPVPSEQNS